MFIECPHCDGKVQGILKGELGLDIDNTGTPSKLVLLECPVCHSGLLGLTELVLTGPNEFEWGQADRFWPLQESHIDWTIPDIARNSLVEAKLCFKARAYSACAVMCGRTIEGVCKHHDPKTRNLGDGLKKLKAAGIIDSRIYDWGEELRRHRNLGAHATEETTSKEDAQDLLDFSVAICEYVFILNQKFQRFKGRQAKQA